MSDFVYCCLFPQEAGACHLVYLPSAGSNVYMSYTVIAVMTKEKESEPNKKKQKADTEKQN